MLVPSSEKMVITSLTLTDFLLHILMKASASCFVRPLRPWRSVMMVGRFSFTGILPVSHGSLIFVFLYRLQFLW